MLSNVDLPQPDGPSTLTNSPGRTSKETPSMTSTRLPPRPKPTWTSSKEIRATAVAGHRTTRSCQLTARACTRRTTMSMSSAQNPMSRIPA